MRRLEVYTGYEVRPSFDAFHNRAQRWAVMICHRRAGKTVAALWDLVEKALAFQIPAGFEGPGRFAFMAPTRVRAKEIAWEYLKRFAKKIPGTKHNEAELYVEFPNLARVTLYGAENERGMGLYLDGIVYDECDDIPPSVDAIVEPALSDRKGWTVHMGILRGRHNLFDRYEKLRNNPAYFTMLVRASKSGIIDQDELVRLRSAPPVGIGESAYLMQYELDASASIANAIYGRQMDAARKENRITRLAIDPSVGLDFFFDIGHSLTGDDWSLWGVQLQNLDILVQTYHARTGELPAHYAKVCIDFWDRHGMAQGTVYLPHDGSRKDRQGRTAVDDLRDAGIRRIKVVHRTPNLWDSINHLRAIFGRMVFDQERCSETWKMGERKMPSGIDCLDFYTKKEEASTGLILDVPVHNEYSHGADGLRTFSEAHRLGMVEGTSETAREHRSRPTKVIRGYSQQSYSVKTRIRSIR